MASLSRGISFRRQGSSGMSWTDTWSFNEDGVLVRTMKEDGLHVHTQRFGGSSLSRIHDSHDVDADADDGDGDSDGDVVPAEAGAAAAQRRRNGKQGEMRAPDAVAQLGRSKSVGSAPPSAPSDGPPASTAQLKSSSSRNIVKWLKKRFVSTRQLKH